MIVIWLDSERVLSVTEHIPLWQNGLGFKFGKRGSLVRFQAETYIFILNVSLVSYYSELSGATAIKIKYDHSLAVYVVLDPSYKSYKAYSYILPQHGFNNISVTLRLGNGIYPSSFKRPDQVSNPGSLALQAKSLITTRPLISSWHNLGLWPTTLWSIHFNSKV